MGAPSESDPLSKLVIAFVSQPVARARELAETEPQLFTQDAGAAIEQLVANLAEAVEVPVLFQVERRRMLLADCRRRGITDAFARLPRQDTIGALMNRIEQANDRHRRTPGGSDLDELIALQIDLMIGLPADADVRPILHNLGLSLVERFQRTRRPLDLRMALRAGFAAADGGADDDPALPGRLVALGKTLVIAHNAFADEALLRAAAGAFARAVQVAATTDHDWVYARINLAATLVALQPIGGDPAPLDHAISRLNEVQARGDELGSDRLMVLSGLVEARVLRYASTQDRTDLDDAFAALDRFTGSPDSRDAQFQMFASRIANTLLKTADTADEPELVNRAIELLGTGVGVGDLDTLQDLAAGLLKRFMATGDAADLAAAVDTGRRLVSLVPASEPRPSAHDVLLAELLRVRFQSTNDIEPLDEALALTSGFAADPETNTYRQSVHASLLFLRYSVRRDPADLDAAITAGQSAVDRTTPGRQRLPRAVQLGTALRMRYLRDKSRSDLDAAIDMLESTDGDPGSASSRANARSNLAMAWNDRGIADDNPDDRRKAAALVREAALLAPPASEHLSDVLWRYVLITYQQDETALDKRSPRITAIHRELVRHSRATGDVAAALDAGASLDAVTEPEAVPSHGPLAVAEPLMMPVQRATSLWRRYEETRAGPDLRQAANAWRGLVSHKLLDESPAETLRVLLGAAAFALKTAFEHLGSLADLELATALNDRLATVVGDDADLRRDFLVEAASTMLRRHEVTQDVADLTGALHRLESAVRQDRRPGVDNLAGTLVRVLLAHHAALLRVRRLRHWLMTADDILHDGARVPADLLLMLAYLNAGTGGDRVSAALRWAETARDRATDTDLRDRAAKLCAEMAERAGAATSTSTPVVVDLGELIREIGGGTAEDAERRLSLLHTAATVVSREEDFQTWVTVRSALIAELFTGPAGGRADNVEEAIDVSRELFAALRADGSDPELTATVGGDLANLYHGRTIGPGAANTARGIEVLHQSLPLVPAGSRRWAGLQAQLGMLLTAQGTAAARGEAIRACEAALTVHDPADDPAAWAYARNALGLAVKNSPDAEAATSAEKSRRIFEDTLDILGDDIPGDRRLRGSWANLHYNLGVLYRERTIGSSDENLRRAIGHFERELAARDRAADAHSWATTRISLGYALSDLRGGDSRDTQRRALQSFRDALTVFTRETDAHEWARAQDAMGQVLADVALVPGRDVDLDAADACFAAALTVYRPETDARAWAGVRQNQALVELRRAQSVTDPAGRRAALSRSAEHSRAALQEFTLERDSFRHAGCRLNLGHALSSLADDADGIRRAAAAYESALEVFVRHRMTSYVRATAFHLGRVYHRLATIGDEAGTTVWWNRTAEVCRLGIDATDELYAQSLLRTSKNAELSRAPGLEALGAAALARLGRPVDALIMIERGRARWLREALERREAQLGDLADRHPDRLAAYRRATERAGAVDAVERRRPTDRLEPRNGPSDLLEQAGDAHREVQDAVAAIRTLPGYADFLRLPGLDEVAAAVGADDTFTVMSPSPDGCLVLTAHRGSDGGLVVRSDRTDLTSSALNLILADTGYLHGLYGQGDFAGALDRVLPAIGAQLMGVVAQHLRGRPDAVLIPTGRLSLLALHAAPYPTGRTESCLLDELDVGYAPSILVAAHSSRRAAAARPVDTPELVAAADTRRNLIYAGAEVRQVQEFFAPAQQRIGVGTDATVDWFRAGISTAVTGRYLHLACHGRNDPARPLDSGIELADGLLTLGELLEEHLFDGVRLVVASACHTAVTDFLDLPDEAIGLPGGFLHGGAAAVVGTLWAVNDMSTALLMTRFYELHRADPSAAPARALRAAQRWLRTATTAQLKAYVDSRPTPSPQLCAATATLVLLRGPDFLPYTKPVHWAPFVLAGR